MQGHFELRQARPDMSLEQAAESLSGIVPEQGPTTTEQDGARVLEMNSFRRRKEA